MKRCVSICFILILAVLLMAQSNDAMAQSIKIKTVGRALNDLPAGTVFHISNGLRVVGKGSKVILTVDTTGSGATGTAAWTFSSALPGGSAAAFDSASSMTTKFTADVTGFYYVTVSYGGLTANDTIYASTYAGVDSANSQAGCFCHSTAAGIKTTWEQTGHARIFREGVRGELEVVEEVGAGLYAPGCIRCHTTGWDPTLDNGNFGYLAHTLPAPAPASFDSTWFKGLPWTADGRDVMIKTGTDSLWAKVPTAAKPLGYIGCESCHGAAAGHKAGGGGNFRQSIDKSLDQAVCNQCHNTSRSHSIGKYFNKSKHATVPEASHTRRTSCAPCHVGAALVTYAENKDTTGFGAIVAGPATSAVTCAVCHDPHGKNDPNNPFHLRTETAPTLKNGYVVPAGLGGAGQLCLNCHQSRYNVNERVTNTPPYYGFVNRFGPHYGPQGDMLYGTGGYQYGDTNLTGLTTHANLENGCVTCHMQLRGSRPNHGFSMTDTTGGFNPVTVCKNCHGEVESFEDIQASYDYDGDGTVEGVQTEVHGLMDKLKSRLPIDTETGEPVSMTKDSLLVKDQPEVVAALWNYWFVKDDFSYGVHNTKYTVALLQKSLGIYPLDVKPVEGNVPEQYALNQNYPNPFNPTTNIRFSLPEKQPVKLEVYDILGNLVKTLVDQEMGAGTYNVTWNGVDRNGTRVASGMYLYKLQAGSFSSVKKMLLVK